MSAGGRRAGLAGIWVVFLAMVGVIVAVTIADNAEERAAEAQSRDADARDRMLVPVPMDQLGAVEIAHAGTVHRFERDPAGTWFYHGVHAKTEGEHGHAADPALAAIIAKAMAGMGRARLEREVPFDPQSREFGVTTPQTLVLLYARKSVQPMAQYAVGDMAPDGVSRYVLRLGNSKIDTLPNYHVDNLTSLVKAVTAAANPAPASGGGSPTK